MKVTHGEENPQNFVEMSEIAARYDDPVVTSANGGLGELPPMPRSIKPNMNHNNMYTDAVIQCDKLLSYTGMYMTM